MSNFILDFLQGAAKPFEQIGSAVEHTPQMLAADVSNNPVAQRNTQQQTFGTTNQGQIARDIIGSTAQIGLDVAAPGAAKAIEAPIAEGVGGLAGRAIGSATAGAALGGAQNVAAGATQGQSGKKLALDFLQGAELGGVTGGAVPLAGAAIKDVANSGVLQDQTGGGNPLSDEAANKVAKSEDPNEIKKTLEKEVGPNVARDVAPTLASQTKDPNIVQGVVKNDMQSKLNPNISSQNVPSPAPLPIEPPTPTSDINTPAQVAEQGTAEEQSLFQSANQTPEAFLNAPGENTTNTHLNTLGAQQDLQHVLNTGGTVTDALNKYMESSGATYKQAQEAYQRATSGDSGIPLNKSQINASLNPRFEEGSNLIKPVAEGDIEAPINNATTATNAVKREGEQAKTLVNNLSDKDAALLNQLRDKTPQQIADLAANQADKPSDFIEAANAVKQYDDLTQGIGSGGLNMQVAYRQNHFLTRYVQKIGSNNPEDVSGVNLPNKPGQGFSRGNLTDEELQQYGYERSFDNFKDELAHDIDVKSGQVKQLALAKGFEEAHPGQIKIGTIGADQTGVYKQLQIPGGGKISLPAAIADEINKRAPAPEVTNKAANIYDTANSELKAVKLGGGLFHSFNVAGSYIGQQLVSGKLFTPQGMSDAGHVIAATFSPKYMAQRMSELDQSGILRAADLGGLEYNRFGISQDVGAQGKIGEAPVLKQLHELTFGRQIPMMKLVTLQQKLTDAGIDPKNMSTEDAQYATKMSKQINKEFGGMNRAIQGLTPRQFRVVSRALLATDYTESQLKTLADAFTKGGTDGNLARQVVFGKALLFAGAATALGAAGGEFKGQPPSKIAEDIIYKSINPQFKFGNYNVGLPETQASEFIKPIAQTAGNISQGKNAMNPTKDFFTARAAAVPSELEQLATNRNFSGQPIYGHDYYGRPVSPGETAGNLAAGVLPIPASQAESTIAGNQNIPAAIANTVGFHVSPTYNPQYAPIEGQTYLQELQASGATPQRVQADTQFFDLVGGLSKQKTKTSNAVQTAINQGDEAKAHQEAAQYNQKLLQALKPWITSGGAQYLDPLLQGYLMNTAIINPGKLVRTARTNLKNNPTAYGGTLASSPLAAQAQTSAKKG